MRHTRIKDLNGIKQLSSVRAADMPPDEKRQLLKEIRQQKIEYAKLNEQALDEIERP